MRKKEYGYGEKHFQKIFIEGKKIVDATCNCTWGRVHSKAWKNGENICWHLVAAINEFNMEVKNGKFKETG